MRRTTIRLATAALLCLVAAPPLSVRAQDTAPPPHAWLFGAWTGGLFPAPANVTAAECLAQPTVIFTRDLLLHASLIDPLYQQRRIVSVRATATGFDLVLEPSAAPPPSGLAGLAQAPLDAGLGCDDPDTLHIQRRGENEITFPGCRNFPSKLVRCPAR